MKFGKLKDEQQIAIIKKKIVELLLFCLEMLQKKNLLCYFDLFSCRTSNAEDGNKCWYSGKEEIWTAHALPYMYSN